MKYYSIKRRNCGEEFIEIAKSLQQNAQVEILTLDAGEKVAKIFDATNSSPRQRADDKEPSTMFLLGFDDVLLRNELEKRNIKTEAFLGDEFITAESQFRVFAENLFGRDTATKSKIESTPPATGADRATPVTRHFSTGRDPNSVTDDVDLVLEKIVGSTFEALRSRDFDLKPKGKDQRRGKNTAHLCVLVDQDAGVPTRGFMLVIPLEDGRRHLGVAREIAKTAEAQSLAVRFQRRGAAMALEVECSGSHLSEASGKQVDELLDQLLNAMLLGARPVAAWRSSLITMWPWPEGWTREDMKSAGQTNRPSFKLIPQDDKANKEILRPYLLPEVFKALIEGDGAFESYDVTLNGTATLEVRDDNYRGMVKKDISAVRLHCCPGNIALLELQVTSPPNNLSKSSNVLWRHYIDRRDMDKDEWSLARLLDFNAEARLIRHDYPRETESKEGNRVATSATLQWGAQSETNTNDSTCLVAPLLKLMFGDHYTARILGDSRARVITSMILDGAEPPEWSCEEFNGLLGRISAVDPYGHGYAYGADFAREELSAASYRRFWKHGSKFMVTGHSFAFVGFRHWDRLVVGTRKDETGQLAAEKASFSEQHIHASHMDVLYPVLYRYFLAIEANIRQIAGRLATFETSLPPGRGLLTHKQMQSIWGLRHDLDSLSSRLIHTDISSQIQGRELTALMHRQFGLSEAWKELDARVRLVEDQWSRIMRIRSETRTSAFFYIGSALTTMLGILSLKPKAAETVQASAATSSVATSSAAVEKGPLDFVWTLVETSIDGLERLGIAADWALVVAFLLSAGSIWIIAVELVALVTEYQATDRVRFPLKRSFGEYRQAGFLPRIFAGLGVGFFLATLVLGATSEKTPVDNAKTLKNMEQPKTPAQSDAISSATPAMPVESATETGH